MGAGEDLPPWPDYSRQMANDVSGLLVRIPGAPTSFLFDDVVGLRPILKNTPARVRVNKQHAALTLTLLHTTIYYSTNQKIRLCPKKRTTHARVIAQSSVFMYGEGKVNR